MRNEPTLTILPGTKIIVGKGGVIELGLENSRPRILALGTVSNPITFCGETSAAGYWNGMVFRGQVDPASKSGGVLTALGTVGAPIQFVEDTTPYSMIGNWNGMVTESGGSVALDYALIDFAGANQGANITALGPLTLTHSTISNWLNWGMQKAAADATDYLTPNTFTNNVTGDVGNL